MKQIYSFNRIIHRAEVTHLNGDSYRMKHRTSIFGSESVHTLLAKSVQLYLTVTKRLLISVIYII